MTQKYIGTSFAGGLTNGQIYETKDFNPFCVLVTDDSGESHLYSRTEPGPFDGRHPGKWEPVAE